MVWSSQRLMQRLHSTPRGAVEFLVVALVFATADPTLRSLLYGGVLSTVGETARIWAAGTARQGDEPPRSGPYRFLRHPYLFGSMLLFMGLCVAGRNASVTAAAIGGLMLIYRSNYLKEEQVLAASLGPALPLYRARVPALLPQLWPQTPPRGGKFSLEYALRRGHHREIDALAAIFAAGLALYGTYMSPYKSVLHLVALAAVVMFALGRLVYYRFLRPARRAGH